MFLKIIEVEPKGLSKKLSNVIGLYHNKKIEGLSPLSQSILGNPVSRSRVKEINFLIF